MSQNYEFLIELVKDRKIPLVMCDFDTFKRNLKKAGYLLKIKKKYMRLCTKSVRVPELVKFVEQQDFVNGIFAFNSAEVLFYATEYQIKDILLGYPIYSDIDAEELCQAAKVEGVNVTVMVDDAKQTRILETHAKAHNVHLDLLIEIDLSYQFLGQTVGVLRSPLKQTLEILKLAQIIEDVENLSLRGIMAYEAQNASLGDDKLLYRFIKRRSRVYVNKMRQNIVDKLTEAGYTLDVVNGGGSGCFQENLEEPSITEIGIGSLLFKPHIFDTINFLDIFN
ncbi:MAG: alanine racemase, partial [Candidatus Lokiarchaeota archaeon]